MFLPPERVGGFRGANAPLRTDYPTPHVLRACTILLVLGAKRSDPYFLYFHPRSGSTYATTTACYLRPVFPPVQLAPGGSGAFYPWKVRPITHIPRVPIPLIGLTGYSITQSTSVTCNRQRFPLTPPTLSACYSNFLTSVTVTVNFTPFIT